MTSSPNAALSGSQRPRFDHTPLFHTSAGDDAVDLAAVAGLDLMDWQQHVLRGSLGERKDGRWQAFEVGLVVPRQNGKGSVLEARELASLFLFREQVIHTAHLFSTATEHRMRLEKLIRNTPDLAERVKGYQGDPSGPMSGIRTGNQDMSITTVDGSGREVARVKFLARSGGNSGRGFTGDLVVLDEAYHLPDAVIAAMMPTMAARSMDGSPQIWYTSSAGMPESEVLNRLRERGMNPKGEDRLAYYEWSVPDDADPDSPESWAQANPSMGRLIAQDFIATERRGMDDEEFKRERLGLWAKLGGTSAIPRDRWEDLLDADSLATDEVAFGFDVTPLRDVSSIAVASRLPDGRVHIELVDRRAGTDWTMPRMEQIASKWSPLGVCFDAASQAASVAAEAPRALARTLTGLPNRDVMQACGEFFQAVMEGGVVHTGQAALDEAVEAARQTKGISDLWRWTREDRSKDISPLVAATLAYRALNSGERKAATATQWRFG